LNRNESVLELIEKVKRMREHPIDIPEDFGDLIKGGVAGINR